MDKFSLLLLIGMSCFCPLFQMCIESFLLVLGYIGLLLVISSLSGIYRQLLSLIVNMLTTVFLPVARTVYNY